MRVFASAMPLPYGFRRLLRADRAPRKAAEPAQQRMQLSDSSGTRAGAPTVVAEASYAETPAATSYMRREKSEKALSIGAWYSPRMSWSPECCLIACPGNSVELSIQPQ